LEPRPADSELHVLIIHRPDATEGYAAYLDSEGFRVSEANDGDDGVAKALALMPDFIVLDFDLDGETTTRLKAHISTRGIPVIALAKMDEVRAKGAVSKRR
jgi:two-component system, OmpR family, phosphate regulon response regulator PhoB